VTVSVAVVSVVSVVTVESCAVILELEDDFIHLERRQDGFNQHSGADRAEDQHAARTESRQSSQTQHSRRSSFPAVSASSLPLLLLNHLCDPFGIPIFCCAKTKTEFHSRASL
jgi:hypothetical protein